MGRFGTMLERLLTPAGAWDARDTLRRVVRRPGDFVLMALSLALGVTSVAVIGSAAYALVFKALLWLVGTGLAIGAWTSSVISRLMVSLLPGLDPIGWVVIVAAAAGLVAVVVIAAHLPSLRQIRRLDPADLLREDVG